MNNINNIIGWWLAYSQGWIDAYRARLGVSLRSPALRESVTWRFPERPFGTLCRLDALPPRVVVGVDMARGPDRSVVVQFPEGRIVYPGQEP